MSGFTENAIDLYDKLTDLVREQAEWSQKVFGPDNVRGPIGPLKHLEKEAKEAYEAAERIQGLGIPVTLDVAEWKAKALAEYDKELADIFLLFLDAIRRSDIKFRTIVDEAYKKLQVNKSREWPEFDPSKVNEAVEHKR